MGKKREEKDEKKKKGRTPCCDREGVRRGAWTPEEDNILVDFITLNGHGTWRTLPKLAGLLRCGKSCRLRWTNYLRPDIKRGPFSLEEENKIIQLHGLLGNKWAAIASNLPERTDNDVKNFWNSHLKKRFSTNLDQPSKSVDMESEPSPPIDAPSGNSDYFLCLWNSQVGESFRNNINEGANGSGGAALYSPDSRTSSLTKVESSSRSNNNQKVEALKCKEELEDAAAAYSDSSNSYEVDDSSDDAMLKLLLDFPVDDNDMGFLEAPHDDVSLQTSKIS